MPIRKITFLDETLPISEREKDLQQFVISSIKKIQQKET